MADRKIYTFATEANFDRVQFEGIRKQIDPQFVLAKATLQDAYYNHWQWAEAEKSITLTLNIGGAEVAKKFANSVDGKLMTSEAAKEYYYKIKDALENWMHKERDRYNEAQAKPDAKFQARMTEEVETTYSEKELLDKLSEYKAGTLAKESIETELAAWKAATGKTFRTVLEEKITSLKSEGIDLSKADVKG